MRPVWICPRCSVLQRHGERRCRRCGGAPQPVGAALVPRADDTAAVLLVLPPVDFPYSRAARPSGWIRGWIAPILLGLAAVGVTFAWDPVVRRIDAPRAFGGESPVATQARAVALGRATAELGLLLDEGARAVSTEPAALPADWAARVRPLGRLHHLDGDAGSATLGEAEVAIRAVWLELVTLPPDGPPDDSVARIHSLQQELSRVTSDLALAR